MEVNLTSRRTLKTIVTTFEQGVQPSRHRWNTQLTVQAIRIGQLRKKEAQAREQLHPSVQKVTQGKETVALKELLVNMKYPDPCIAGNIREGFKLVGEFDHCPVFEKKDPEDVTIGADPKWLELKAEEIRADLQAAHRRTKNDEITEAVWFSTNGDQNPESETAVGWAEGAFTPDEVTKRVGTHLWTVAHRFGVKQGEKVRQIDDFSRSFTNACATLPDRVALDSTDEILAVAKTWYELMDQAGENKGTFWARWESGQVTKHRMHSDFEKTENQRLKGSCLDLESAYRQLAVREDHKRYSVLGLPRKGRTEYYVSNASPLWDIS